MKYFGLWLLIGVISWWWGLPADAGGQGFLFWRGQGIQLTGWLMMSLMALLVLMAARPRWLEQRLGGLDHLYLLHKWSGISTGVLAIVHWALTKSPRWLVDLGLLQLGGRPPRVGGDAWRGLAKSFGEWAFYGMLLLVIISLVRALPYGWFRLIHKAAALLVTLAAVHSLYLLQPSLRWSLFGWQVQLSCVLAAVIGLACLFGWAGRQQRYAGTLHRIRPLGSQALNLVVQVPSAFLQRYQPGQFALLTLHPQEGAHPFTVVSSDVDQGTVTFAIKGLGDYTRGLETRLQAGQAVQIEGPYGRFVLPAAGEAGIWIAGGIGITPFVAWMEALSARGEQRPGTRLIYCVNRREEAVYADHLQALAAQTGIDVQVQVRDEAGLLDVYCLPLQPKTRVWFCGPQGLRDVLRSVVMPGCLHYERFDFR